jgi:hypothetical protein
MTKAEAEQRYGSALRRLDRAERAGRKTDRQIMVATKAAAVARRQLAEIVLAETQAGESVK